MHKQVLMHALPPTQPRKLTTELPEVLQFIKGVNETSLLFPESDLRDNIVCMMGVWAPGNSILTFLWGSRFFIEERVNNIIEIERCDIFIPSQQVYH